MRTTIVLVALVGVSTANWELYKDIYGKVYSADEDAARKQIFNSRVRRINEHNLRHDLGLTTYRMGLNQFTDLIVDELQLYKGMLFNVSKAARKGRSFNYVAEHLPNRVDWRTEGYVTPVKDQGQCGSCWAFSATGSLEGQNFWKTGKLVSLSEQNLVDCSGSHGNGGCEGGYPQMAFDYIQENGGIDTEKSYPYKGTNGTCHFNPNTIGATCSGYVDIAEKDENALKHAVATIGPVSVCIHVVESFYFYKGGIFNEPECSGSLNHAVLIVGYGSDLGGGDYWLVKNSWGKLWGEQGYIRMSRNKKNQCDIADAASYPIV